MDFQPLFIKLIEAFLKGEMKRADVEDYMALEVPIGEVASEENGLLSNCEWALRHINEEDYWTTEIELQYLLECLHGKLQFNTAERDAVMRKKLPHISDLG